MDIQKLRLIIDSAAAADGAKVFAQATDKVVDSATKATDGITKMESALDSNTKTTLSAADANTKLAATQEQVQKALKAAGGDMSSSAFKQALLDQIKTTQQVTDSTRQMTLTQMEAIAMNDKLGQSFNTSGAGLGRLRMGLTSLSAQLTGTNPLLDRAVATIGSMGIGTTAVVTILGTLAGAGVIYKALTEDISKTEAEQTKLTKSLEAWYEKERQGPSGNFTREIDAEREKIKQLQAAMASMGGLGAVNAGATAAGDSKGLAWTRMWLDFSTSIGAAASGNTAAMRLFWSNLVEEIKTGKAKATIAINDGSAAIHAANVQAQNNLQKQQADALAQLITSNHATAAERAQARDVLKKDIAELARLDQLAVTGAGTKQDQQARVALAEEIKKLQDALDPPKIKAAEDHLAAVRDNVARLQQEAANFGKDASIDTRISAMVDDLDRLEKKYPQLTGEIEKLKDAAKEAGDEMKQAADDKVAKQIDDAYYAQQRETDAVHDLGSNIRDANAMKAAALEIDRLTLELGHQLTQQQMDKIVLTHMGAAALQDEADAARKSAEAQKKALEEVVLAQKHAAEQMRHELAQFFDNLLTKGLSSFKELWGEAEKLFERFIADMAAKRVMDKIGPGVLGAFGIGTGGNSANPTLGAAGAAAGIVGFGSGYMAGDALNKGRAAGSLIGAASGAAAGAALGSVVPVLGTAVGAVVGGVTGMIGGFLGAGDAAAKAKAQVDQLRDAFKLSFDQYALSIEGQNTALDASIAQIKAQKDAYDAQIEAAYAGKAAESERNALLTENAKLETDAVAKARALALQQAQWDQDDLDARALIAAGHDDEATALQALTAQQKEYAGALNAGKDASYLAQLQIVQQMEATAAAITKVKGVIDSFTNTIGGLQSFKDSLQLSQYVSDTDRLKEAQRQYDIIIAQAGAGDQSAASNVPAAAQTLLDAARAVYASGQGFQDIFTKVNSDTDALIQFYTTQRTLAQQQLDALLAIQTAQEAALAVAKHQDSVLTDPAIIGDTKRTGGTDDGGTPIVHTGDNGGDTKVAGDIASIADNTNATLAATMAGFKQNSDKLDDMVTQLTTLVTAVRMGSEGSRL